MMGFFDGLFGTKGKTAKEWYWEGCSLAALERNEEAIRCYDMALEIDSKQVDVWYDKGVISGMLGRHEEAIRCYDKILEINPEGVSAWSNKGLALDDLRRHEEAIRCYDKILEINPEGVSAWSNKGVALVNLERYEEAVRCFDRALEIAPNLVLGSSAKKSKVIAEEKLREQQSRTAPTPPHQIDESAAEERFSNGGSLATSERYEGVKTRDIAMDLEIHFHQQDEASVYLESNTSGKEGKFGEILMFCYFTLRSMANLGRHPITSSLATLLFQIGDHLIELPDHYSPDDAKLVDYKGNPGRKRFIAGLRYANEKVNFEFKPKGFGLLARGMGYYAPNSVIILLRYLVEKRIDDKDFISNLSQAAKKCGEAYISGDLSPRTQHQIALMIAFSVAEMGR